jgi:hypothetical protein
MQTKKSSKTPGQNGFRYREQYGLIVRCKDEAHQRQLFHKLKAQGLRCKVVAV